jgi:UDP-N-acetylmuramoyl-L-alanyl-D-glutamate--2,6-diaminopimelate ligase
MRVWGITGTNGKTTTAWILADFLQAAYVTTVEVNTLRRRFSTGYTTPPLTQLNEIFGEMADAGAHDCVMEVSSHAIHQRRTGETVFAGGAFTNLSEDHLDYHKTMDAYFEVKLDFARRLAATSPGAPFAVCLDGGYGAEMLAAVRRLNLTVLPVTRAAPAFDLSALQLAGDYNASNVLTAAALAEAAGVSRAEIQRRIPALTPRWGRLEYVPCASRARVYVDFAHTPDGLENVLAAARGFTAGRLWVVFGAGGDRDAMKRPLMGAACARGADRLVVTSDNPRSEDPLAVIDGILAGIDRRDGVRVEPDRARAIAFALSRAEEGDTVLVCGKGHETTQEIAGVHHPFDDRAVVRAFEARVAGTSI